VLARYVPGVPHLSEFGSPRNPRLALVGFSPVGLAAKSEAKYWKSLNYSEIRPSHQKRHRLPE
jgi:hypothetical protein